MMNLMMNFVPLMKLVTLAAEGGAKKSRGGLDIMLLMLLPVVGLFWWMSRSQKKKEQKRKDMLGAVRKGDKVVTIGGIHGEVTRLNEREIVLMVDKSKGIELRFARSAIATTKGGEAEGGAGESAQLNQEGGSRS